MPNSLPAFCKPSQADWLKEPSFTPPTSVTRPIFNPLPACVSVDADGFALSDAFVLSAGFVELGLLELLLPQAAMDKTNTADIATAKNLFFIISSPSLIAFASSNTSCIV